MKKILLLLFVTAQAVIAATIQESAIPAATTVSGQNKVRVVVGTNSRSITLSNFVTSLATNGLASTSHVATAVSAVSNPITNYAAPRLIFEGDDFVDGYPYDGRDWTTHLLTNSNYRSYSFKTNAATGGDYAQNLASEYASEISRHRPGATNGFNAMLFVWAGRVDISQTNNAGTIYAALSNEWRTARIDGFRTVAFTIPNFSAAVGSNITVELVRSNVNRYIKQDRTLYDHLVDTDALFPYTTNKDNGQNIDSYGQAFLARWINTNISPYATTMQQYGGQHYGLATFNGLTSDPATNDIMRLTLGSAPTSYLGLGYNFVRAFPDSLYLDSGSGQVAINYGGLGGSGLTVNGDISAGGSGIVIGNHLQTAGSVSAANGYIDSVIFTNEFRLIKAAASNKGAVLTLTNTSTGAGQWIVPAMLQLTNRIYTNNATTATVMAAINPAITAGAEWLAITFTPIRSDTKLRLRAQCSLTCDTANAFITLGLYNKTATTLIATDSAYCNGGATHKCMIETLVASPGAGVATAYSVRFGSANGANAYINYHPSAGGTWPNSSSFTIEEVNPFTSY